MFCRCGLLGGFSVSLVVLYANGLSAEIINVPADYATIQGAIDAASDGDEVVVAPGAYVENINFNGKVIALRSSSDDPEDTIIDADGSGRVVICNSGETATTVLQGFTLTGGNSSEGGGMYNYGSDPTVANCAFSGNTAINGGGMFNYESDPTVANCTFSGNAAQYGGGMSNVAESRPTIVSCTFSENTAEDDGGGMLNIWSDPTVANCTFSGNAAQYSGGMSNSSSDSTITNCTFSGNTAVTGGGMRNYKSNPMIANCTFSGNTAEYGGGMANENLSPAISKCTFAGNTAEDWGGGIYNQMSTPMVTNCAFIANVAEYGGGIYNRDSSNATVTSCTFSGNTAGANAGGMRNYNSDPAIINSVLWGNSAGENGNEIDNFGSTPTVTYSCVQGGHVGEGNIGIDPSFVDADGLDNDLATWQDNDLHLSPESPCVDVGNNAVIPAGVLTDLGGNPRIANGMVDMGAYEWIIPAVHDECLDAIPVNMNEVYSGSTVNTTGINGSSCATNDIFDVWHSFTPSWNGEYIISLCGSAFDTTLTVFDQCDGIAIGCNDDSVPGICDTKLQSHIVVPLQRISTYFIRIAGYGGETGDYDLIITGPACTDELVGDVNGDCKVNILDFVMMTANWLGCNLEPQTVCWE